MASSNDGIPSRPPSLVHLIAATADEISFNERIRPLFAENCLACHGPDTASRKADLRLDTKDGATAAGAIVPGEVDEDELVPVHEADDDEAVDLLVFVQVHVGGELLAPVAHFIVA